MATGEGFVLSLAFTVHSIRIQWVTFHLFQICIPISTYNDPMIESQEVVFRAYVFVFGLAGSTGSCNNDIEN